MEWLLVELGNRLAPLVGRQVGVSQGHRHRAVAEQISHGVERHTLLDQARGKVMA
jgi:hypothetical protein